MADRDPAAGPDRAALHDGRGHARRRPGRPGRGRAGRRRAEGPAAEAGRPRDPARRQGGRPLEVRTLDGPAEGPAPRARRRSRRSRTRSNTGSSPARPRAGRSRSASATRWRSRRSRSRSRRRPTPGSTRRRPRGATSRPSRGRSPTFRIAFDAPPSEAVARDGRPVAASPQEGRAGPGRDGPAAEREGNALVATLDLDEGPGLPGRRRGPTDGRVLPKNKHRIDVREDRAPRVVFDEPDEALEVHPIAEVRHRVRVDDDFGLTRAGIVFRFNDGEEKTLILKDFPLAKGKKPKTSATLEEMLLLETLAATPQDSVTYYAFAEDNFPGDPEADRDRPPLHRHPRLQARVQAGRARLAATATRRS